MFDHLNGILQALAKKKTQWKQDSSATNLVSVTNTRVFRTALTALTEPRTLWLRITCYPLHCISKMYLSHWSERMSSVNLDASISRVSDPRRALLPAFRVTGSADDKPGSTGDIPGSAGDMSGSTSNHSHVFSLYSHLCISISMYLYSYPSTHAISGLAAGGAWEQFEVHLKMTIEWTQRYTPRPWSGEFGDTFGGGNRAYLGIHLEAVIERDWTSTRRQSMDGAPGDDTLFISWFTRNRGNVTMCLHLWALMESWLMAVDRVGRYAGSGSYTQGSSCNHEDEGKTNNLGWMLYSVSTHDHVMER